MILHIVFYHVHIKVSISIIITKFMLLCRENCSIIEIVIFRRFDVNSIAEDLLTYASITTAWHICSLM